MKVHHTVLYGLLQQAMHGFAEISVKFLQRIQGFSAVTGESGNK